MKMLTDIAACNTIRDNAISKLSWKFGESKWNPYWVIVLTNSSGTNYVPNEHGDVDQYDPYAYTIQDNAMLKLFWKLSESKWNPRCLVMLTSSAGTNFGLNEHEDFDQYGSFTIQSKIIAYQIHPASLVDLYLLHLKKKERII